MRRQTIFHGRPDVQERSLRCATEMIEVWAMGSLQLRVGPVAPALPSPVAQESYARPLLASRYSNASKNPQLGFA